MAFHVTIFADGPACSPALRNRLKKGRYTLVLDGAAEAVRHQGWKPNMLAGDFDSIKKSTLAYFTKKGVPVLHTPDQNYTDLEKALAWCVLRDATSIWIVQALGGRADHSFVNFSLLKRFHHSGIEITLFQDGEKVRFVRDQKRLKFRGKKGRLFAVLPFPECTVSSKGLAFEMKDFRLALGVKESSSNAAKAAEVKLSVEGEALVVEGT